MRGCSRARLQAGAPCCEAGTQRHPPPAQLRPADLGNCIRDLAERGSTLQYRNSALTELLRPALGGGGNEVTSGCNTLIVGCISPLTLHAANTRSTLE